MATEEKKRSARSMVIKLVSLLSLVRGEATGKGRSLAQF